MKNVLLVSVAFVFVAATTSFAATSVDNQLFPAAKSAQNTLQMLADNDSDGGDNSGSNDSADNDSNDDHGGASGHDGNHDEDGDDNDIDNDHSGSSGHGKKHGGKAGNSRNDKPRVPGGRGCDSAHDRAEHPECSAG